MYRRVWEHTYRSPAGGSDLQEVVQALRQHRFFKLKIPDASSTTPVHALPDIGGLDIACAQEDEEPENTWQRRSLLTSAIETGDLHQVEFGPTVVQVASEKYTDNYARTRHMDCSFAMD